MVESMVKRGRLITIKPCQTESKFCFHCGGPLSMDLDEDIECSSCGAVYSKLEVVETEYTYDGHKVVEIGFDAEIVVKRPIEEGS